MGQRLARGWLVRRIGAPVRPRPWPLPDLSRSRPLTRRLREAGSNLSPRTNTGATPCPSGRLAATAHKSRLRAERGVSAFAARSVSQLLGGYESRALPSTALPATDSGYFMTLRDQTLADWA